jgi:hypothetical protein
MNYRDDDGLKDFVEYNDLGLPMAYLILNEIVSPTENSDIYIDETYNLLLAALEVEDLEYTSLDQILESAAD